MAFWSAENATKAYLTTLKTDQRTKEPNVAEFISALAAGNNAKKIAVACAGAANADILVALIAAANQTQGQVICVLRGIEELIISKKMLEPSEINQIQFVVGESNDDSLINDHFGEADFVLVDCNIENNQEIVRKIIKHREEKGRTGVAVVVGYNARGSWRFSDGRKTQFLPIGEGLLVTRVNEKMMMMKNNCEERVRKSRWVVKVDKCTGEEHVFRVRAPRGGDYEERTKLDNPVHSRSCYVWGESPLIHGVITRPPVKRKNTGSREKNTTHTLLYLSVTHTLSL